MKYKMNVYKLRKPNLFLNSHLKRFGVFENMGTNSNNFNEISSNDYLKKLSTSERINQLDYYWNRLLTFFLLNTI